MTRTRRALLATLGAGTVALAGCLGGGSGGNDGTPVPPSDGPIATAPLPDAPADREYAEMGTGDPVVTYFGNWKCPFCAEFSVGSDRVLPLEELVTEYVEPGDLRVRYRGVAYTGNGDPFLGPDAPRATRAGLAVWTSDPASYWRYHEYVMANQPSESEQWATTDRLVAFAEGAGVAEPATVRERIEAGTFEGRVEATSDAFRQAGAEGTPSLLVDGETVSPFDPEAAREALDSLVG
jgi:protein-disulfide isomerase